MINGWSLFEYEGEWNEDRKCSQGIISDVKFSLDIHDNEGDVVTISAHSADGFSYHGDYRYRKGSYPNGKVVLERFKGGNSEAFIGEWIEGVGSRGRWIIKLET